MITAFKGSRDQDCKASYGGPNRPVSVKDLEDALAQHVIGNNALSYLYNLAYSNFFCI